MSPVVLAVLPTRGGAAAENMAADFLLLRRYPESGHARFRAYGWHRPACTFGFSQKLAWVRAQVAALTGGASVELCRRPTGGGVVDHRADWTYALVLPRGHPLESARALESYRAIHAALATALVACGQPAELNETCPRACGATAAHVSGAADATDELPDAAGASASTVGRRPDRSVTRRAARLAAMTGAADAGPAPGEAAAPGPGVCFTQPELYDVIDPATGAKLAGAAQKRTKHGLLLQGSIARSAVVATLDWEQFHAAFVAALAHTLHATAVERPWPEFPEGEHEALAESYAAPEWLELR